MWFQRRFRKMQHLGSLWAASAALMIPLGSCNFSEFTTTTTTTLDGREVVQLLVRSAILTPLNAFVDDRINALFDALEDDDE